MMSCIFYFFYYNEFMWQVTERKNIISSWFFWHYSVALSIAWQRWRDFSRFNRDYFSIPFLLRTLFSPWRRYSFSYGRGFDIGRYLEALVFNAFSRVMGAIMRIFVILTGSILQILIFLFGALFIIIWLLLPVITIIGLLFPLRWLTVI